MDSAPIKSTELTKQLTYKEKLGEAIGRASVCWSELPTGVFDSTTAASLAERLNNDYLGELKKEKERLMALLMKEMPHAVNTYKALMKHTGAYMQTSMSIAYERGLRDALKIITKESKV